MKDKFCRECGSKLEEHCINSYDPKTGKREKDQHCTNKNCEQGCEYVGHIWKFLYSGCKRCGYQPYDVY